MRTLPRGPWTTFGPASTSAGPAGSGPRAGAPRRTLRPRRARRRASPGRAGASTEGPGQKRWPRCRGPTGRDRLTPMSEYPTLDVVKSDIAPVGAIAPPKRKARPQLGGEATPLAEVRTLSVTELERDLTALLRTARPTCVLSELADDGSPRVASLVSVWLLSQVGKAVGRPKLVNLSKVGREELRSIGGVARLVHRTLHPVPAVQAS
jgi:hypothetical protein